jgi:hypothetical protein
MRILTRILIVLWVVTLIGSAPVAKAETTSTVPSTTTATTSSTQTTSTVTPARGATEARDNRWLAGAALGFGLIAAIVVVSFVRLDRKNALDKYTMLVEAGAPVQAGDVSPQGAPAALIAAETAGVPPLTVEGPSTLVVGTPADYIAKQGADQVVARWTAEPPEATGDLGPPTSRLTLTPKQGGAFILTATVKGLSTPKQIVVTTGTQARTLLPFVGAGWGSVVVAIVIAAVTAALGFAGALTGEAVATILGALVGYVVAKGQTETASGSRSGSSGSGSGSGGSGS